MKKLFLLSLCVSIMLFSTFGFADTVYQEDANTTTCAGNWDLLSPCSNGYDGAWDLPAVGVYGEVSNITFVYDKPENATNSSWLIGDYSNEAGDLVTNYTFEVPSDCWNYSETNVTFMAWISNNTGNFYVTKWMCYNGTWKVLADFDNSGDYEHALTEEGLYWEIAEEVIEEEESTIYGFLIPVIPVLFAILVLMGAIKGMVNNGTLTVSDLFKIFILIVLGIVFTATIFGFI